MNQNGFREDELVTRRMNGQTRVFPVVGGRLRLAHEQNDNFSLKTEMVSWDGEYAVFRCSAETKKGRFVGYGTANSQRDARLAESLIELAETRSIARALRFAGYGMEFCSAEEVDHVVEGPGNGNGKVESKPQDCGNDKASQAQVRALHALTKKADYADEDIARMISPFEVHSFKELPRQAASQLISTLQTEVAQ
jgi:hypothetical protein